LENLLWKLNHLTHKHTYTHLTVQWKR
jgi:hypothetical protein